jgi:hypothetical protein
MLFSKFDQALSGDYVHVSNLSQNEIGVNKNMPAEIILTEGFQHPFLSQIFAKVISLKEQSLRVKSGNLRRLSLSSLKE